MPRQRVKKTPEIIDLDETPSPPASKRSDDRKLRSENKPQDTDKICEFPLPRGTQGLGKSRSVIVTFMDYKKLEYDTYLNDTIIDLYLAYLHENKLNKEDNVYLFSTWFYKCMVTQSQKGSFEKNTKLSAAQKRHRRVEDFTENVDLFSKDMLIIPICEHSHWYLVIVIKPGQIVPAPVTEARRLEGEPFFIVLDRFSITKLDLPSMLGKPLLSIIGSLGKESHVQSKTAVINVRSYLEHEWGAKVS